LLSEPDALSSFQKNNPEIPLWLFIAAEDLQAKQKKNSSAEVQLCLIQYGAFTSEELKLLTHFFMKRAAI
jgi:hypothetical protein